MTICLAPTPWWGQPAGMRASAADPIALASAHRHYAASHGSPAGSDLALLRRLGVTLDESDDPELSRAGALLVCAFEPGSRQVEVLITIAEGVASSRRFRGSAPLLTAFDGAWELLDRAFPAQDEVIGLHRRPVRAIPERALREAVVNGLTHRDYEQVRGHVVAIAGGDPPSALKVQSPGGFPAGVQTERLLATRSRPRNPDLAGAFHVLGLAEGEGIGIDTIYRLMLCDGHPAPDIQERGGDVVCRLTGGRVDAGVRAFFDNNYDRDPALGQDVRVLIAMTSLMTSTPLRPDVLAVDAQCGEAEAFELLERLDGIGVVRRLVNGGRSFVLSDRAATALRTRVRYRRPKSIDEHWKLIRASLDVSDEIGRADVAQLLGVRPERAATILSELYNVHGRIVPVGNSRGRGVRYRLP